MLPLGNFWGEAMAAIQIGDAATAGLRLIGRRPLSVLMWGLITAGYFCLILVLFGSSIVTAFLSLARSAGQQASAQQIVGFIGAIFGAVTLLLVGMLFIGAMIQGAAIRAELEPEKRGLAYLRFGRQELWLIAVNFVTGLVIWAAQVVMTIPLVILTAVVGVGAAAGIGAGHDNPGAALPALFRIQAVSFIGQIVILTVSLWIWSRLSMGTVMSFQDREFRLFESWALTKGHAGSIFVTMLLVFLMLLVFELVAGVFLAAGVGATVFANQDLRDPAALAALPPSAWIGRLAPLLAVGGLLMVVFVGLSNAMTWGAVARMYRQLKPPEEIATTFA